MLVSRLGSLTPVNHKMHIQRKSVELDEMMTNGADDEDVGLVPSLEFQPAV